jgi:hypothetical protein
MKKVLAVSLVLNCVLALGLLREGQVVHAGGGGGVMPCSEKNGDVDGNGNLEITDAVRILTALFLDPTTSLAPLCQATSAAVGLPASGQTKCYDTAGNVLNCNNAAWPGQDGLYQATCPKQGRFVDNGDGTVTDNCTGLMWQKASPDLNGDGAIDQSDQVNWQAALQYCDNLKLGGPPGSEYGDWRLPNVHELQSIIDYGRSLPAVDPGFQIAFAGKDPYFWTSTTDDWFPSNAFTVRFDYGEVNINLSKTGSFFVLAVRTAR